MKLNSNEIQKILPHRHPFLLVDKITECTPGEYAKGIKCVTSTEPWFPGHFPEYHVMPGVLILEAMAQTGAVALLSSPGYEGKTAFFGGVKNARFKKQVLPGDVLELECRLTAIRGGIGFGEGTATVNGELAAKAEISFAIG